MAIRGEERMAVSAAQLLGTEVLLRLNQRLDQMREREREAEKAKMEEDGWDEMEQK
jgi:hypothetical protein